MELCFLIAVQGPHRRRLSLHTLPRMQQGVLHGAAIAVVLEGGHGPASNATPADVVQELLTPRRLQDAVAVLQSLFVGILGQPQEIHVAQQPIVSDASQLFLNQIVLQSEEKWNCKQSTTV